MIRMYFISSIVIRLVPRHDVTRHLFPQTYLMIFVLLHIYYAMLFKVITTIAVTVPVFVLASKTPYPRVGSDGIAIPLTKLSDTDSREFHATSHNA
jgi:hypothetical protein